MIKRREEIEALGAAAIFVAYDEPALLSAKMLHEVALPFPLLLDRTRETYARWGMGRTGLTGAMLSPSLNLRYLKLLAKGERFLGFAPDMFQLGGDFVVDKQGTLVFAHRMRNTETALTRESSSMKSPGWPTVYSTAERNSLSDAACFTAKWR